MMENQAIGDGGAIFAKADEASEIELTLINNTISNNQAAIKADGIYLQSLDQGKIEFG